MIWQSSSDILQSMDEHSFLLSTQLTKEAHDQPLCPAKLVLILSLNPEFLPVRSRRLRSILVCFRDHHIPFPKLLSELYAPAVICLWVDWGIGLFII